MRLQEEPPVLEIRTAAEISDPELEARWAVRRAAREAEVLRQVLRLFVDRGGPVPAADVAAGMPARSAGQVRAELQRLHDEDLIDLRGDQVVLAYPFSTAVTAFAVELPGGRIRHACCSIDALGIAPMVRQPVHVRSRCHHCGADLAFRVTPDGPEPEASGVMAWVGRRATEGARITTSL
jgi:hypothetical protein